MQVGLIMWAPAGGTAMLARTAFGVVIVGMAVPVVARRWSSLRRTTRRDVESGESVDLDALWELYKRGEISWDEYLRGKVEGGRGLSGVEGARTLSRAKEEPSSNITSPTVGGS